eukprot:CAMPEP_0174708224 /NCGR_PEP_ID=MMETSP1094-20130205/10532_1 /TAXON_ID=156173 /ORGANISM="Chrysochromulina brevifilum, Strain UTEX LB 985" /LENGTH=341 /DNA_ID=CAMNT_0015906741 /DNA_START=9 /DNA_END=1034 /DNA_ORIENTATION=+
MEHLAQTYLSEMYRGLARHRHLSPRLQTFANCTGLFTSEALPSATFNLMMAVFEAITDTMDAERAITQVRRDQFFLRWGEMNELYLPVSYVLRGLSKALEHEHPEVKEALLPQLTTWIEANAAPTSTACGNQPATSTFTNAKLCVLGAKRVTGGFVHADLFIAQLASLHRAFCDVRVVKARRVFATHDTNGDGFFSRDEFASMMRSYDPNIADAEINDLWQSSGGKDSASATLKVDDLEAMLFNIGQVHRAATQVTEKHMSNGKSQKELLAAAAAQVAREELGVLVALWDTIRNAPDELAKATIDKLVSSCTWSSIVHLKMLLKNWVRRSRAKRAATQRAA